MTLNKHDGFTMMVSVVGLSNHGRTFQSSSNGIGKSCLCCRFLHSGVDDYVPDHPSLLALHEFEGQVISAEPLLYWGRRTLHDLPIEGSSGKTCKVTFEVFEHTVFYHDETSHPFSSLHKLTSSTEYAKRLSQMPECTRKFSYYSRDTIGFPDSYECVPVPANLSKLDRGLVIVIDLSKDIELQLDNTDELLKTKLKKLPIVIAATKRDQAFTETHILRRTRLTDWASKEKIPVVETSAHENINVEDVFRVLAAKTFRKKKKIQHSYLDYAGAAGCMLVNHTRTKNEFQHFLGRRVLYSDTPISSIENTEQYKALVHLMGKFKCDELFARHVLEARNKEVMEYDGVKENPDLQLDLLEEFIERSSDLFAHESMLRTLAASLSKASSAIYVNEGGISPHHTPSHAVSVPSTDSEQSASYVKFSRSNSPITQDIPIDGQPTVPMETPLDENSDPAMDKLTSSSEMNGEMVFTPHGDLTSETGQDVVELYDIIPNEPAPSVMQKLSVKNCAEEPARQVNGNGSLSSDEDQENASSDEESETKVLDSLPPPQNASMTHTKDESTGLSLEASIPCRDHLTVQSHAPSSSIKARAAVLQRQLGGKSRAGDESVDGSSRNTEQNRGQSVCPDEHNQMTENCTVSAASGVESVRVAGPPMTSLQDSSAPVGAPVSSSVGQEHPHKVDIVFLPRHEKQSLKPPVSQKPKRLSRETTSLAKSPYEQTTPATSVTEQIYVNQTSVLPSPSTDISTQSSSNDAHQQMPVANTSSSSSTSSQPKMSKPPPPTRPKPAIAVGNAKSSTNYPKVSPKPVLKNRNYQDTVPAPTSVPVEKIQADTLLPPKPLSFDSAMASSNSPTFPKRSSVDSGVVKSRPKRQDYEPRLPGIRQRLSKDKQQVSEEQELKPAEESVQVNSDRKAEQENQHNGVGSKQTEEIAQQLQGEVAKEQGQLKERSRQEEEREPIPVPADSVVRRAKLRKDYEPRLHLLRQKRELEKERERAEQEQAEQEKQQAEAERRLKEQQQMEALRLADQRPLLPTPDDSANLARVLTQLQKENKAPPPPHMAQHFNPPTSSSGNQWSSFGSNPSTDVPHPSQPTPPPNYPAPNPYPTGTHASPIASQAPAHSMTTSLTVPHPTSAHASPVVTRKAPDHSVTTSLPVSTTSSTHSPPHSIASFHSYPGADELPPPIPARTMDMYLPNSSDTVPSTEPQETSSVTSPPSEKKKEKKNYSMIKIRWKSKKSTSGDGKAGDKEKERSVAPASDASSQQQSQPQATPSRTKPAKPIVNMRRRALPPEPEIADIINQHSHIGDKCPEDYEIMDAEYQEKLRQAMPLSAMVDPPQHVPVNVTMPFPMFFPQGMVGTVAPSGSFMAPIPMTAQPVAPVMYPQAVSAYPFPQQMTSVAPEVVGGRHATNVGFVPQYLPPDTRPPAPLPANLSPAAVGKKRRSTSLTPAPQATCTRSLSLKESAVSASTTDEDGYENTDEWGVPTFVGSKGYSYARQQRFSPLAMFPRSTGTATPPRGRQQSPLACLPRSAARPTTSSISDNEDDDDYVNMQSEMDVFSDYENAETIRLLQESHLIMPGGANLPPPVPSKASHHHNRRHSMDDHIYYNEEFQELLEEWRMQNLPEAQSQFGAQSSRSPKKQSHLPTPSSRQPTVPVTDPSSREFSDAGSLFAPVKQAPPQTFSQTDEETGQVHAQQTFSTNSLPKPKSKPYLPPRNIPRPIQASAVPEYLDITN